MIRKLFRQMSAAQIAAAMTTTLCLLIDSIVIGRFVGVDAMSAYGIASPLLIIFTSLGTMTVSGVQVVLGKALGRGDRDGASACYSTSVVFSVLMGAAWILLIFLAGSPICTLLGAGKPAADNPIFAPTLEYLRGFMIGAPFFFLNQILTAYLQSLGKRRRMLISVVVMTVTDVVFDLISVFVFRAGMFGIGLASSLSYLASFLVCVGFFLKKDCLFRLRRQGVKWKITGAILRAGSPVLVNQVCYTLRVYLFNLILMRLSGTVAVAAFAVFSTLSNLLYSIGFGAGSVTLMLSTMFFSDEDVASLRSLVRVMINYTLVLITGAVLIAEIFAPQLIRLFLGSDAAVLAIAVTGLRIFLPSVIPNVINNIFKNYFQGTRHTWITNLISFLESLGLMIPSVLLFSHLVGLTGFWIGTIVGQLLTRFVISILIWKNYGHVAFTDVAFSYLKPDFGAKPEDCLELSVSDRASAVAASESLCAFGKQKGLSPRTAMLLGLCAEEVTVNILTHGFTKDRHSHNVEVRLVVEPEKCILRIRDNCYAFDPTKYIELHQDDDPTAHIGLRMVMRMVKEANYVNTLGLNNLTLIL